MPVRIINKQKTVKVSVRGLRRVLEEALAGELGRPARVNVLLTDDEHIAKMHLDYMGEAGPTDVLSFELNEEADGDDEALLGEIAVSGDTAGREAARRGTSAQEELTRYAVHGLLHLVGYDDKTESKRRRMWRRQEQIVKRSMVDVEASRNSKL